MYALRVTARKVLQFTASIIFRSSIERNTKNNIHKGKFQFIYYSTNKADIKNTMDPKRVLSYDDMLKVIHQPEKVIIDVRNPDEVKSTGKIPSSINIPLGNVQEVLTNMSEEEFIKNYNRSKPTPSDELIFYCRSGRRSTEALDKALKLGFSKSKNYVGSWNDWSSRTKQ